MKYRADIDGLRTIAVVPVLVFHVGLGLPGGFVGVDVFFVISGFLITRILWEEMKAGTYSIMTFYKRRVRRIFPALFVVLALTTLAATVIMLP
ncbi:acyltransferase [Pseudoruegeria sp. SK021]|uniref:acyltransferase family protein n=1 Tax=Pseudoruegeria sp. SK021 TaxID=1933035 RepID=UPI000A326E4E|nr:acyltransferase [Pseudoruegeria sp. SK021]